MLTPSRVLLLAVATAVVLFLDARASAQAAAFPSTAIPLQTLSQPSAGGESDEMQVPDESDQDNTRDRTPEDDAAIQQRELKKQGRAIVREEAPETEIPAGDAPIVQEIEIAGASPEEAKKAKRVLETREGEPLNPLKQREDIRKLYDLGLFRADIAVQAVNVDGGVKLQYQVQPNPKVSNISVSGNTKVATKKIVSDLPVKAGQVYTIQAQNKIRESVARFYEEKGYTSAVVKVEERPAPGNAVDLAIVVDEGTKTKIKDLVVRGNNSIGNLPINLRVNNKGSWGPFSHYFNESKFQQDMETIKGLYMSRGFLDVDVRRGDFQYAADQSWVSPAIDVTEGPQYRIGRMEAKGFTVFDREEIIEPFRSLQGETYTASKFNSAAEKVKAMYGNEGFLLCKVTPDFHKDPSTGMVDVDLEVSEGPRIYVGDVKVLSQTFPDDSEMGWLRKYYSRFSPPVKDEVVQREVQLRPGQVYRRFDEVKTRERLRALNVFEEVKISDQLTADPCVRDCVVDVTQGNTGNLIFGVGFGDTEGGFLYANYIEHNLFGLARDLRVSGLVGSNAQNFEISYLDRYFMGRDLAAQFSLFRRNYSRTGDFDQTNTGATAEFTRPLSDCLKQAFRVRLEMVQFDFEDDEDDLEEEINDYMVASIRYRLTEDTRNDVFFPTEGRILSGGVEAGVADGMLLKFEGQYAKYFCLGNNWVFAMNNQAGLMPYDATSIGYGERLFLGGSQDMRGFRLAGAGPHDGEDGDVPLGGSTKLLSQLELRYPFTDNITGVLFTDIGMLGRGPLEIDSPRMSVGGGMRLRLPIAQLAVDLGVPVIKKSEDQTQIFHFTMTSCF